MRRGVPAPLSRLPLPRRVPGTGEEGPGGVDGEPCSGPLEGCSHVSVEGRGAQSAWATGAGLFALGEKTSL